MRFYTRGLDDCTWDRIAATQEAPWNEHSFPGGQFRLHNWRVDIVRKLDKKNKVVAHGVASTLEALPSSTNNEWRSAADVDVWGFTWVASRKRSEPWKQFHAVDWFAPARAENHSGMRRRRQVPLWMQPQVTGRPREDGRITDEKEVRLWNLISMAALLESCIRAGGHCSMARFLARSERSEWMAASRHAPR